MNMFFTNTNIKYRLQCGRHSPVRKQFEFWSRKFNWNCLKLEIVWDIWKILNSHCKDPVLNILNLTLHIYNLLLKLPTDKLSLKINKEFGAGSPKVLTLWNWQRVPNFGSKSPVGLASPGLDSPDIGNLHANEILLWKREQ